MSRASMNRKRGKRKVPRIAPFSPRRVDDEDLADEDLKE